MRYPFVKKENVFARLTVAFGLFFLFSCAGNNTPEVNPTPAQDVSESTEAYDEEKLDEKDTRVVLHLHPALAPFKAAVLPLSKKLSDKADEVFTMLSKAVCSTIPIRCCTCLRDCIPACPTASK